MHDYVNRAMGIIVHHDRWVTLTLKREVATAKTQQIDIIIFHLTSKNAAITAITANDTYSIVQ